MTFFKDVDKENTEVIVRGRQQGKTSLLVTMLVYSRNSYLVVRNESTKRRIIYEYNINSDTSSRIFTHLQVKNGSLRGLNHSTIMVDDAEMLLREMLNGYWDSKLVLAMTGTSLV